jgi:hypothetical protein
MIQDTIKGALEIKVASEPDKISILETNKYLSRALDKIEDRCQSFEHKIDGLKPFKRMVKGSKAM